MKYVTFILSMIFLLNVSVFADYGNGLRCKATDDGWEEHWGGHSSCSECLSEHGSCTMKCYEDEYTFTAEGRNEFGTIETVMATGMSEFRTKSRALDRCYMRGLNNCYIVDKQEDSHLVSSRQCRRPVIVNPIDNRETCTVDDYLNRRPDVRASGMGALVHYNRHGRAEGMCNPIRI